jgi:hypothetical protein
MSGRLRRDLFGTILVAAIAVPYFGYLINGEMPLIKDPRGMSATGLVLGVLAFQVLRRGDKVRPGRQARNRAGNAVPRVGPQCADSGGDGSRGSAVGSLHGSIFVVWAVELLEHAGILPGTGHRNGLRNGLRYS